MAKKLGRLANRYAKALRQAVLEELGDNGSPTPSENCADSLEGFAKLWQSKELEQALLNPMFSKEDRIGAVTAFAQQLDAPDIVRRFLNVLVERGRLFGIVQIAEAFRDLINESKGAVQVSIETARDVADSERAEVRIFV